MIDLPITDTTCGAIFVGWKVLKVWHEAYLHIYVLLGSSNGMVKVSLICECIFH